MATIFAVHVLPRLVPLRRPVRFALTNPRDAAAILADLAAAVASGELDPTEAEKISALARARVEAVDVSELLATVRRLEGGGHANGAGGGNGMAPDHEAEGDDAGPTV